MLYRFAFETILKEMSDSVCFFIEVISITGINPLHHVCQAFRGFSDQQMDMIIHETIGINKKTRLFLFNKQCIKKPLFVLIIQKQVLSFISPQHNMIGSSFAKYALMSRHNFPLL